MEARLDRSIEKASQFHGVLRFGGELRLTDDSRLARWGSRMSGSSLAGQNYMAGDSFSAPASPGFVHKFTNLSRWHAICGRVGQVRRMDMVLKECPQCGMVASVDAGPCPRCGMLGRAIPPTALPPTSQRRAGFPRSMGRFGAVPLLVGGLVLGSLLGAAVGLSVARKPALPAGQ